MPLAEGQPTQFQGTNLVRLLLRKRRQIFHRQYLRQQACVGVAVCDGVAQSGRWWKLTHGLEGMEQGMGDCGTRCGPERRRTEGGQGEALSCQGFDPALLEFSSAQLRG